MHGNQSWVAPEANWLTIKQAPFFFSPRHVRPGNDFRTNVEQQVRAQSRASQVTLISDFCVAVCRGEAVLVVDGNDGELWLEHAKGQSLAANGFSHIDYRSLVIHEEAANLVDVAPEHRQSVFELSSFGRRFVRRQREHYADALRTGHAVIVGRWGNITEPFRPIQPDQWQHFHYDVSSAIARSTEGDIAIFSPMVMPIEKRPLSPKEQMERDVVLWLVDHMQRTADRPDPRNSLQSKAQNRWLDLSERNFLKLWETAKKQSGVPTYGKAGRPKKIAAPLS